MTTIAKNDAAIATIEALRGQTCATAQDKRARTLAIKAIEATMAPAPKTTPKIAKPKARKTAPLVAPVPLVTIINGESKADFKARLATMPAGAKAGKRQFAAVNRRRAALNMRTYATMAAFREDFPTMRSAAIEVRILSA